MGWMRILRNNNNDTNLYARIQVIIWVLDNKIEK